jgi:single-strand DNA-binding protein
LHAIIITLTLLIKKKYNEEKRKMADYNHVTLVGNLTKAPKSTKVGESNKTNFTLAVNRDFKVNGKDTTDFIIINAWGKLGDICDQYLEKGKKVLVDGKLRVSTYEDKKETKWYTEVVADSVKILSPKK